MSAKNVDWVRNYWIDCTPKSLRRRILKEPLTKESILNFLEHSSNNIEFDVYPDGLIVSDEAYKFNICINLKQEILEQGRSLIYWIAHGVYRAMSIGLEGVVIGSIIEEETVRFYNENREFVDSLVEGLKIDKKNFKSFV